MKTCNIGIIGAGRIGKLHAENIMYQLPQFKLLAMVDPFLDENWAKGLAIPFTSKQIETIFSIENLDAVLIASPSNLHTQHIIEASRAKKAIFCEKPIGLTIEEINHALAVVNDNNTLLQIGFNRRFDPSFAELKQQITNGMIGKTQTVHITSRDPACPSLDYCKTSGGLFMDMAIHDFDMARFLISEKVTEVYATGSVLINPDFAIYNDIDTALVQLRFANDVLAVIDNSRQAIYGYDQRIEVQGQTGLLQTDNQTKHPIIHLHQEATAHANPEYFFLERYQAAYLNELSAFYVAWLNKTTSPVSGEEGLAALQIALAAKQSLATNQPIKVMI